MTITVELIADTHQINIMIKTQFFENTKHSIQLTYIDLGEDTVSNDKYFFEV